MTRCARPLERATAKFGETIRLKAFLCRMWNLFEDSHEGTGVRATSNSTETIIRVRWTHDVSDEKGRRIRQPMSVDFHKTAWNILRRLPRTVLNERHMENLRAVH